MERTCTWCQKPKPLEQFPKSRSNETGKEYRRHRCKACENELRSAKPPEYRKRQHALHKTWTEKRLAAQVGVTNGDVILCSVTAIGGGGDIELNSVVVSALQEVLTTSLTYTAPP